MSPGRMLALELGVLAAMVVVGLLTITTRIGAPVRATADATCVLVKVAKSTVRGAGISDGLEGCDATPEEAASIWHAHIEAERIEGFVPRSRP